MFGYFFQTVSNYLGEGFFKSLLWVSLIVCGAAVLSLLGTALFIARQDDQGRAVKQVMDAALVLAQVFGGAVLAVFLVVSLRGRYAEFSNLYGRVTETNFSAVQSIWGSPHNQRNLEVRHYVEEEEIIEKMKAGDDYLRAQGIPGEVESRYRKTVTREVPQDSIVANDHLVTVKMNYRKKGSAYYTTFEDEAEFKYTVKNRSDKTTTARFTFPLPISTGMVHGLRVFIGDQDWSEQTSMSGEFVSWSLPMNPGQEARVKIVYQSRGMDYWAFRVQGMEPLTNFRLQVVIPGFEVENNPIGCMSPTGVVHDSKGTALEWKLDRAVTNLGMGVILPSHPQPGHYESALLKEAPAALFIFMIMIVLARLLLGARMALLPVALLAIAHERFFALLCYFRALDAPIALSLSLTSALLIGGVALFLLKYGDAKPVAWFQTFLFALLTLVFSLCIIETQHTDWLIQILYLALLLIVMVMTVRHRKRAQEKSSQ